MKRVLAVDVFFTVLMDDFLHEGSGVVNDKMRNLPENSQFLTTFQVRALSLGAAVNEYQRMQVSCCARGRARSVTF